MTKCLISHQTFHEAIQSVWFIQLILQIESNGHSLSYGRFDQYMYPYLKHDLDNNIITEDEAVELLTNLWIKTLTINKVRSQAHTFSSLWKPNVSKCDNWRTDNR